MSAGDTSGGGAYSRQNVLSIYLPAVTLAIGTGVLIPAIPIYARSFNIPFEVASLVIIVQQLGSMCASLPTGLLADRFGRRRIVLAGPILLAISSFLAVTAQSFPELVAYRFIAGIGSQMWQIGRLTMIADTGGDHERGKQITTMHSMESTGRLLSPVIGGFLAALWDVRAPFVVHAVLCLAAIAPSFKLVKETAPHLAPVAAGRQPQADAAGDGGFRALLTYPVMVLFAAQFCAFLTRGPMYAGQINLFASG
ncbi:MAG: arabinose efflux permease family protein [Chloroflexi bacterium]|nr:arabinose efflux permease family protein [Chloroflexota bacterium]